MIWSSIIHHFITSLVIDLIPDQKMKHFLFTSIYPLLLIAQMILLLILTSLLQLFFFPIHFPPTLSFLFVLSLSFFAFKAQKYTSYSHLLFLIIYLLTSLYLSSTTDHQQPTFNQALAVWLCTILYLLNVLFCFARKRKEKHKHLSRQAITPPDQST